MDKGIIKAWLLEKKTGVYSVIVETYNEQALSLKPSLFIDWLARELGVKTEQISPTGVRSAINRFRSQAETKKPAKGDKNTKKNSGDFDTEIPESFNFK